jgi:uncharacterized membrane protein YczE
MVSDRLIVVLIVCAILMSAVSIYVTLSLVNTDLIPDERIVSNINYVEGKKIDSENAKIVIEILKPIE